MSLGGSNGGATIMDLYSGTLSHGENFINFYKSMKTNFITPTNFKMYRSIREKIQKAIAESFELDATKLFLTHMMFFSRLTATAGMSIHDEYWHVLVDKVLVN